MFGIPLANWLYPGEYREVVRRLLDFGLITFSNDRDKPLKMGGTTDVYINLRDARDDPEAMEFLGRLFAMPLSRLDLDRFVEVPDSVSCFAPHLASETGLPYLTIRKEDKGGRVSDAKTIGHPDSGDRVVIVDDVITNGASKVGPFQVCVDRGLDARGLVVLVDRQQGWQQHLADQDITIPVWAGMTLHDVRRQLIEMGEMQRCDPEVEAKNPMIVALDGRSWADIYPVIDQLRTTGCILKVNDMIFGKGIEHLLPDLSVYGRVMVDLKCHDIPATVANTCKRLKPFKPWAVTVHASGGVEMVQAAVAEFSGTGTKVLGVTVLTSLDDEGCKRSYNGATPEEQVKKLAEIAHEGMADGLVCSAQEAAMLAEKYDDMLIVTPGIRSPGADTGDQARVNTPVQAVANGANHMVMGRQVFAADDPVAEVKRIMTEELNIS